MKQSNSNFISELPRWLFWTIIILIILVLFFSIYSAIIYKEAMASKHRGYPEAEKRVLSETDIETVEKTTTYSGEETYFVVFGLDKSNDKKIAFVPQKKDKINVFDANNIVTKEQINAQLVNECPDCKQINITAGILDQKPVWEASYVNKNNNYVFDYYSMKDASRYERFQMKRNYK